jgi:hypothetical protein
LKTEASEIHATAKQIGQAYDLKAKLSHFIEAKKESYSLESIAEDTSLSQEMEARMQFHPVQGDKFCAKYQRTHYQERLAIHFFEPGSELFSAAWVETGTHPIRVDTHLGYVDPSLCNATDEAAELD